jgi:hypothetical protein
MKKLIAYTLIITQLCAPLYGMKSNSTLQSEDVKFLATWRPNKLMDLSEVPHPPIRERLAARMLDDTDEANPKPLEAFECDDILKHSPSLEQQLVAFLLVQYVSYALTRAKGFTPISHIIPKLRELANRRLLDTTVHSGGSFLHHAASYGDRPFVQALLECGANKRMLHCYNSESALSLAQKHQKRSRTFSNKYKTYQACIDLLTQSP